MIFRADEQKYDLVSSWHRPDRAFFASGACHILAAVFLETYPHRDFRPYLILPNPGFRGSHVFVSDGKTAFDYHGFSAHHGFLDHYLRKIRRSFPHWLGSIVALRDSPSSVAFCKKYDHRLPGQFLHDPRPRARNYLKRFPLSAR